MSVQPDPPADPGRPPCRPRSAGTPQRVETAPAGGTGPLATITVNRDAENVWWWLVQSDRGMRLGSGADEADCHARAHAACRALGLTPPAEQTPTGPPPPAS